MIPELDMLIVTGMPLTELYSQTCVDRAGAWDLRVVVINSKIPATIIPAWMIRLRGIAIPPVHSRDVGRP